MGIQKIDSVPSPDRQVPTIHRMPVTTRRTLKNVVATPVMKSDSETERFLSSAWNSYDSSVLPLNVWAREEARRFYHSVSKDKKFADVYNMLMEFGSTMSVAVKPVPETLKDAPLAKLFVADGEMTDAEWKMGRADLNKILFREHTHWWSAFVEEAREDKEAGAPSASDRFSYHCARIISRKTGLKDNVVAPIVAAWLIEKAGM